MMLIDHVALSILATGLINNKKDGINELLIIATISAIVPDILALYYHPGTIEYLYHRKYTNSIIIFPIYSFALSSIIFFFLKKINFKTIFATVTGNYFLHILFDHINEYGAPLLYPISNTIYALDIIHSFDPVYMTISLILLTSLLILKTKKMNLSKNIIIIFISLYTFHTLTMLTLKNYHTYKYKTVISQSYPDYEYVETIPKTFWRWKGIAKNGISILTITDENKVSFHKGVTINDLPEIIKQDSYTKKFFEYARYPMLLNNGDDTSLYNAIYSIESYNLKFKINGEHIISKTISGFDISDK